MRRHVRLIQLDPPSLAHVRCPTEYMLQQVIAHSSRQVPCVKHYQGLEVPSSRPPRAASSMLFQSAVSLAEFMRHVSQHAPARPYRLASSQVCF